jgi:ABC-2 type transport system permease protein
MNRFVWLLKREWMQHHRGWLWLALLPLVLALAVLPWSTVDIQGGTPATLLVAMLGSAAYVYALMAIVSATVLFQAAGMARRDQQDRSIEFWLSLPTGHVQSVLAMVLMHLLLMPLLVLVIGFVGSQLVAMGMVMKLGGAAELAQLGQPVWFGYNAVNLLRLVLGVAVAALWSAPVVLAAMAAGSWLKGWGVPALVAATIGVHLLVRQFSGSQVVWETVQHWFTETVAALMPLARGEGKVKAAFETGSPNLESFTAWVWGDVGVMLRDLATPSFAMALVVAGIAFALVVLHRAGGLAALRPGMVRAA